MMTPELMTPLPVLCPARTERKRNTGANGRRQVGPAGLRWGGGGISKIVREEMGERAGKLAEAGPLGRQRSQNVAEVI